MVGGRLRELRKLKGYSLEQVASRVDISVATLSRIETNQKRVDVGLFTELLKILDARPADVLTEGNGDDELETLRKRIGALDSDKRTILWRQLADERNAAPRTSRRSQDLAASVEELLAQIDFLRAEIDGVKKRISKS